MLGQAERPTHRPKASPFDLDVTGTTGAVFLFGITVGAVASLAPIVGGLGDRAP
jgi:hypothetical protein